jgi:hypothetical protein
LEGGGEPFFQLCDDGSGGDVLIVTPRLLRGLQAPG